MCPESFWFLVILNTLDLRNYGFLVFACHALFSTKTLYLWLRCLCGPVGLSTFGGTQDDADECETAAKKHIGVKSFNQHNAETQLSLPPEPGFARFTTVLHRAGASTESGVFALKRTSVQKAF